MNIGFEISFKDLDRILKSQGYEVRKTSELDRMEKRLKEVKIAYSTLLSRNAVLEESLSNKKVESKADKKVSEINEQALVSAENALKEKEEIIDDLLDEIQSLAEENERLKRRVSRLGFLGRFIKK